METQITETAAEKVYQNHLILDEIYFWLEETADMIGCAMLCRYGVEAAAKRLYEKVPIDLPMRLYDAGCPFNRIFTYWQAVSSVQAGDVWPDDSPIARLAKQFPRLSYIYFRVPESEVHGRIGRVGRNINNDFKEMAIAFPDLEETPAQTLFDQGFSLRGQEAKFYLVDIHIGETRRPSQRIRYRYPFEVFDGREDEEVVDQGFVPVSIKVLLGRMRSFFAYSGSVAPGAMAELLDAMPNLCAFAIRMTSVEQQSGSQEDQEMEETVRAAVSGMPPTLEYLDIQESAYSSHSHIHPFYTTTASPLQTLYLATEMEPYAIHIKTALLLSYLKEGPRPGIRYQGMLRASCIHVSYHADEDGLPKPSYSRTRSSRHSGRVYTSRCRWCSIAAVNKRNPSARGGASRCWISARPLFINGSPPDRVSSISATPLPLAASSSVWRSKAMISPTNTQYWTKKQGIGRMIYRQSRSYWRIKRDRESQV